MNQQLASTLVCILSHGNWSETLRAVGSAQNHGLDVLVGVTVDTLAPPLGSGVAWHRIDWLEHFADTRNQLYRFISDNYSHVLWLDSDEVVETFAPPSVNARLMSVLLKPQLDETPKAVPRYHANCKAIRWRGAVHEYLYDADNPGVAAVKHLTINIGHDGYEDAAVRLDKYQRNADIATREPNDAGSQFAIASYHQVKSGAAHLDWLTCYKTCELLASSDSRARHYEMLSALMLCENGLPQAARKLLSANPELLPLQLAMSVYEAANDLQNELEITDLYQALVAYNPQSGDYSLPVSLVDCDSAYLESYITQLAKQLVNQQRVHINMAENDQFTMADYLQRSENVDAETFDGDIILMDRESLNAVCLDAGGAVLWEALQWRLCGNDLVDLLATAQPQIDVSTHQQIVQSLLSTLFENGFIQHSALSD